MGKKNTIKLTDLRDISDIRDTTLRDLGRKAGDDVTEAINRTQMLTENVNQFMGVASVSVSAAVGSFVRSVYTLRQPFEEEDLKALRKTLNILVGETITRMIKLLEKDDAEA